MADHFLPLLREFLHLEPVEPIPEESTITNDQYIQLLKIWKENQGENPGKGIFGQWAWESGQEDHFKMKLYNMGVRIEELHVY